jgi:hypothetical protein
MLLDAAKLPPVAVGCGSRLADQPLRFLHFPQIC